MGPDVWRLVSRHSGETGAVLALRVLIQSRLTPLRAQDNVILIDNAKPPFKAADICTHCLHLITDIWLVK